MLSADSGLTADPQWRCMFCTNHLLVDTRIACRDWADRAALDTSMAGTPTAREGTMRGLPLRSIRVGIVCASFFCKGSERHETLQRPHSGQRGTRRPNARSICRRCQRRSQNSPSCTPLPTARSVWPGTVRPETKDARTDGISNGATRWRGGSPVTSFMPGSPRYQSAASPRSNEQRSGRKEHSFIVNRCRLVWNEALGERASGGFSKGRTSCFSIPTMASATR